MFDGDRNWVSEVFMEIGTVKVYVIAIDRNAILFLSARLLTIALC